MNRLRRIFAVMLTVITLFASVPVQAQHTTEEDITLRLADAIFRGETYVLAASDNVLSADIVQNGGGLRAIPLEKHGDTLTLSRSHISSVSWRLTPEGTLYNDAKNAYIASSMGNLLLTLDESSALCVRTSKASNVLEFSNADSPVYISLDDERELFKAAYTKDNSVDIRLYSIVSDENAPSMLQDDTISLEDSPQPTSTPTLQPTPDTTSTPTLQPTPDITSTPTQTPQPTSDIIPVTGISLCNSSLTLTVGEVYTLVATVTPPDATDPSVTWSITPEGVATVHQGLVTALSSGQAVITATTNDGSFTAECVLEVIPVPTYTVRFIDWDGTVLSTQSIAHGESAVSPQDPYREGYAFIGWDRDFSCVTEDMDINALYLINTYTVNFYDGYQDTLLYSEQVNHGGFATPPDAVERSGYDFFGWSSDGYMCVESDMDIYALWTPHIYSITYVSNGGTLPTSAVYTYTIESPIITFPVPTRQGYSFIGWHYDEALLDETVYTLPAGSVGDIVLYAEWEPVAYTISYVLNGGTFLGFAPTLYTIESVDILLPTPAKRGYTFLGWYESADFSGEAVSLIPTGSLGNRVFYARWTPIDYTISYVLNGGTNPWGAPAGYCIESPDITLPIPTRRGYTFIGWHYDPSFSDATVTVIPTGSVGNIVLYAEWVLDVYTITYVLNGGTNPVNAPTSYTVESPTVTLPVPTRHGYTFSGFYTTPDFSGTPVFNIPTGSVGNISLYAKWTPVAYSIDYNLNGGAFENTDIPTEYTIESPLITLPTPTRRGYIFGGWYTNQTLTGNALIYIPSGSTGNVTLYAAWTLEIYTIGYMLNGGINPSNAPTTYSVESDNIMLPVPTRAGYTFSGFYTSADFSGNTIIMIPTGSTGNITLYAQWTPVTYSISYVLNGGSFTGDAPTSYTIESDNITLPIPSKTAYDFMGWYRTPGFTGSPISNIPQGSMGNITLYARWSPTVYSITYNYGDGEMPDDYETSYTIESGDIDLPRAQMTGHVLVGWHDNPELTGIPQWSIPSGSYGDREYYANWRTLIYTVTFMDMYDNVIETVYAEYGTSVTPPTPPEFEGLTFTGWSEETDFVYGNMTVYALYDVTVYDVVFVDMDYSILSEQAVPHGEAAIAPEPPEHEGSVFVFWSVDFSCVTSDMTIVAVYRSTEVTPPIPNPWNLRFETAGELFDSQTYVIAAEAPDSTMYALSSFERLEDSGLWGIPFEFSNAQITPEASFNANLYDLVFSTESAGNGVTFTSSTIGAYIAGASGGLSMFSSGDEFQCVEYNGSLRLYNAIRDSYLVFDHEEGYFDLGPRDEAAEISLYRLLTPEGRYDAVQSFHISTRYSIVAVRPDGKSFMLTCNPTEDGGLTGVEGVISNNRFYLNHEVEERDVVFRAVGGNNDRGYNLRNAQTEAFLSQTNEGLIADGDIALMGSWVYTIHPDSGYPTLYDNNSGNYLFCSANGRFSASSDISHTQILIFEHSYIIGDIGDANNDGTVNTGDAIFLLRYCIHLADIAPERLSIADANGDGLVNSGDSSYILKYTVCLVDWLGN